MAHLPVQSRCRAVAPFVFQARSTRGARGEDRDASLRPVFSRRLLSCRTGNTLQSISLRRFANISPGGSRFARSPQARLRSLANDAGLFAASDPTASFHRLTIPFSGAV